VKTSPWVAALVLLLAFVVIVVLTTPWHPFGELRPDMAEPSADRDFSSAEQAAAREYASTIRLPALLNLGIGLIVTLSLGLSTLGAAIVSSAARPVGGGWVWQVLLGGTALLLIVRLTTLPMSAWSESIRREYGLSTRDWGGWALDVGRSFAIQLIGTLLALLALVALARALPRVWWVVAAAGAAAAVVLISFIYPLVVEPVFNTFSSMPDGELRTSLVEMAESEGIAVDDVLVADASRRTTTLNAYVSGFGATHRIVVYDTLLDSAPDDEVRSIVAHELGHTVENDVRNGTLLGALAAAGLVCALAGALSVSKLLGWSGASGPSDPRVIALVLALVAVASLLASPVENLISRRVETRADVHALSMTNDAETFVRMQRSLALTAYSDPNPPAALHWMFASHPTKPQRIALARTWAELHDAPVPADQAPRDAD
jgi:STE24 endopeptidase